MTETSLVSFFSFIETHSLTSRIFSLGKTTGQSLHQFYQSNDSLFTDLSLKDVNLVSLCKSLLRSYKDWWLNLVQKDPIHVLIETILVSFLAYLIFYQKKKETRKKMKDRLSDSEIEHLLEDWKKNGRLPLAYDNTDIYAEDHAEEESISIPPKSKEQVIIEKVKGVELTVCIQNSEKNESMTALNFATHDYLGMSCPDPKLFKRDVVKEASIQALSKYGCGSCGPRAFYGTIDAHLELEKAMADFMKTDGAILYSDGASCAASSVAAFAKRGDLLVVDEGIYEALGTGVTLSRANIKYFKHNDMQDLRRVLERVQATDESLGRKSNDQRRFIVAEALYRNHGTVCPLDELVKLKEEFCYRLILDESNSFGVMGKTGRGGLEHFGLEPMKHAEIITINLENSMGAIGGVSIGNFEIVDHQRLSGAGYIFSASLPPFLASAAQASLKRMETEPIILETLKENVDYFYKALQLELGDKAGLMPSRLVVTSAVGLSPLVFLQLSPEEGQGMSRAEQVEILDTIASTCLHKGVMIVSTGQHVSHHLHMIPSPALRMTIQAKQSKANIDTAVRILKIAVLDAFRKLENKK